MIEEIIVNISSTPSVYMGLETTEPMKLNGIPVQAGYAPWPTAPDILCQGADDLMCGLSFPVFNEQIKTVQEWVKIVNSEMFKLRKVNSNDLISGYNSDCGFPFCLELLWTIDPPTKRLPASLVEDVWYYSENFDDNDIQFYKYVVAIGLASVSDIASDFDLKLPTKKFNPTLFVN